MYTEQFESAGTTLRAGVNLIEASAGTGKTYAIAMLVLRFVVEHDLDIKQLLVVTFTKAATEELKSRVRARLAQAKNALLGECDPDDTLSEALHNWRHTLELDEDVIRRRLDQALMEIDQAGIFTIHGFCQRILNEHALESGQLFDCELSGDIAEIKQACADDFWRRSLYSRSPWEVAALTGEFRSPEQLLASVDFIEPQLPVYPDYIHEVALLDELRLKAKAAVEALDAIQAAVAKARQDDDRFKSSYVLPDTEPLRDWLLQSSVALPDFSMLTSIGLIEGLNGNKFRQSKKNPVPSEEQKALYLQEYGIDGSAFDQLDETLARLRLNFRRGLLHYLQQDLDHALQQQNLMSFDDLISRLADALQGDKGEMLIAALRQRFRAALIDEFQDTDQQQWFIFSRLFAAPDQSLYLIGDPKQAIYKFRGADIYSYFAAQDQADQAFTLGKNWRSHPNLVEAVNQLFRKPKPFLFEQLAFKPVAAARSADDGALVFQDQALAPLLLWQLQANEGKQEYWTSGKARRAILSGVVAEILELLNQAYFIRTNKAANRLRPQDIAILVRTNTQAREYQQTLVEVGVPAVLNSKESVFASSEALELHTVLQAIVQPGHLPLLKQALSVSWFKQDGQQLYRLGNDESELDAWVSRFQDYLHYWRQDGLMSMLQRLFEREQVEAHLAQLPLAERRLTNLHHLIELLQQAAIDEHLGVNKLLDWLHRAITQAGSGDSGDERQLRLESDEDAVKIITMHGAKGLEYPVVFCPSLWQRGDFLRRGRYVKCHQDGAMVVDLGSECFEQRLQQALDEELAEDLRLFYVAVTRAKYRCYLNWADVRSKEKANDSAMAWLLDLSHQDFAGQQAILQRFGQDDSVSFDYRLLELVSAIGEAYRPVDVDSDLQCRVRQRSLYSHWQMSSYTALSALSRQEVPELPEDKADEPVVIVADEGELERLPKGAHTGNVLHDLLEKLPFEAIAIGEDFSDRREQACLQYGLKLERPELVDALLQTVVNTPLQVDNPFCLSDIPVSHCLKEMPFYLSMQTLDAAQINRILAHCPAYQALNSRQLSGYLTGFIDLVCFFDGRYYVMDYKSNSLLDYRPESLLRAMREHNYGLQYWIYTLVLHRYLRQRLPDYDYESHFGGVKYLFMRGMDEGEPASGVFSDRPALQDIERLGEVFFGVE